MGLTLEITSEQKKLLGENHVRSFNGTGATIGRSLANDWVLPDPDRYISARHAMIDCQDGAYRLIDISTNGVFINDVSQPIGKGNTCRLSDGDRLRMGAWEFLVSIDDSESMDNPVPGPDLGPSRQIGVRMRAHRQKTEIMKLDQKQHPFEDRFQGPLNGGSSRAAAGTREMPDTSPSAAVTDTQVMRPQVDTDTDGGAGSNGPLAYNHSLRDKLQQSEIFDILSRNDAPGTIGVCGCHARAGATSVALNLAIMLRERTGEPVTLIEANLRAPSLRELYGISSGATFADLAKGRIGKYGDLITLPGTQVSAVTATSADSPLFLLNEAKAHIKALAVHGRRIILDLPPSLLYPDMTILAPAMDCVLVVVEAEETRWQVAREARKQIESAGIDLLGVVLNRKRHYIPEFLYRLL
jgi:Mrp family chromosome partitioning ATPase